MTNLEKLIADCDLYAQTIEGVIVVDDNWKPGDPETREPRETLLHAASALRAYSLAAQQDGAKTRQHIGWLKQYAEMMDETNWKDMRALIQRQLFDLGASEQGELK